MKKTAFFFGVLFALTAVILGAFGAHALKEVLSADQLTSFQTGIRYQMYHALALLAIALKGHHFHLNQEKPAVLLFISGIFLFSTSIYLLNLQEVMGVSLTWLGPVTPLGGGLLIIGWTLLLVDAIRLFTRKEV